MRVAARGSFLSLAVHAVEDAGAVCGARPRDGRWRLSTKLPVSCPRCLLTLGGHRLAVCETMGMPRALHLRMIGERGYKPREGIETRTLCGQLAVYDVGLLEGKPDAEVCARCANVLAAGLPRV